MASLTEEKTVIPTFDEILQAHRTLGDLLSNHFQGIKTQNPAPELKNKLGIIAAPTPIKK